MIRRAAVIATLAIGSFLGAFLALTISSRRLLRPPRRKEGQARLSSRLGSWHLVGVSV